MKKYICLTLMAFVVLSVFGAFSYFQFHDGKLHLIFCDVGQGDGILIKTPSGRLIIMDGGPDEKILGCISRHTPFWEHTITLMLLSHPHADHLNGLISILDRYSTRHFITERLVNKTSGFSALQELISSKKVPERIVYKGDSMRLSDSVSLRILSPTTDLIQRTSPNGIVGESKEFANLITLLSYKNFHALLVGDSQSLQIESAAMSVNQGIDVMQVPHHGSLTGLSEKALELLRPKLAVISVGKNNYGHPAKYTLGLLKKAGIPVRMTIKEGDVEIVSGGAGFTLVQ